MVPEQGSRRIGRSILAVLAGIVVGVALSLGTDAGLRAAGVAPSPQWHAPWLFGLATAYRTIYNILGSYVIAWLAPNRPMGHALFAGVLGVIVSAIGAAAAWNRPELGPRWYPLLLVVLALPCAWVGAKLRLMQMRDSFVQA
jgi:hypothetical protein